MDYERIKDRLLAQKSELLQRVAKLHDNLHPEERFSADFAEQVVERGNVDVLHALNQEGREELKQVNRALSRLDSGDYAVCSRCGDDISPERLEALPYTDLCIRCASGEHPDR